ncbi:META domain-containing protein [Streptomyces sp. NPDC058195]|uniref:META domain-containing protein n=1 Tax=Streptomyces sp. NPDC058195 TaxID=3346375 RepID=UPI0036EF4152
MTALAPLALLALAACGTERGTDTGAGGSVAPVSPPPAPLTGTTWTVTSLTSGPDAPASPLPADAEGKARLIFGKGGSVHGVLGCNSFRGTAKISGSVIAFGPMETTKMMCPAPRMKLERALMGVLDGLTTYRTGPRALTLTAANGTGLGAAASTSSPAGEPSPAETPVTATTSVTRP